MRIALYGDRAGWHVTRLERAFRSLGCDTVRVVPQHCEFDTTAPHGLRLPGFGDALPDGVFVRSIPAGSFEQVTFRLGVLHALRACGVPVANAPQLIERTVDKSMTSWLLARAGVPTPPTWVGERDERAAAEVAHHADCVRKPLFGAEGEGLRRVRAAAAPPPGPADGAPERIAAPDSGDDPPAGGVHYLQRFIDTRGPDGAASDLRVFVIGGRARHAMRRTATDGWITNVARGARPLPAPLTPDIAALAERACAALATAGDTLDHAGVDIIEGDGAAQVLEVNSVPAWRGLQSVCDEDIALALARDFVTRRLASRPGGARPPDGARLPGTRPGP